MITIVSHAVAFILGGGAVFIYLHKATLLAAGSADLKTLETKVTMLDTAIKGFFHASSATAHGVEPTAVANQAIAAHATAKGVLLTPVVIEKQPTAPPA